MISLLLGGLAVLLSAYLIPSVHVDSFGIALIVALVLGFLNAFVRPVLIFLTLPINILTLGLFTFVVNILILYLAAAIVPGFRFNSILSAILFSLILSLITSLFGLIL